jgi:hypothetical protein
MPIAGPESHPHYKQDRIDRHLPTKNPVDDNPVDEVEELVGILRQEFAHALVREKSLKDAARRRRIKILMAGVLVPAGALLAAAIVDLVTRRSH